SLSQQLSRLPVPDRSQALLGFVVREAAAVLRINPERIEAQRPLARLGLDSLMAVELRNRLQSALGLPLSPTLLWTAAAVAAVAGRLLPRGEADGPSTPEEPTRVEQPIPAAPASVETQRPPAAPEVEVGGLLERLESYSDAQIEALWQQLRTAS